MSGGQAADATQRIVVTGIGAVSPYGRGRDSLWKGVMSGRTAIGDLDLFDTSEHRTQIAGQVRGDFSDAGDGLPARQALRLSRADRFALSAAREALEQAGLGKGTASCGVFLGCSTGGMSESEHLFLSQERGSFSAMLTGHQNSSPGDAIARVFGFTGPVEAASAACAAAAMAMEGALQALRSGEVEVAITGGADGLCQLTYAGFNALRAVDTVPCRPFRADREGLSLGEGAGVLVLETLSRARDRDAVPIAEFAGAGSTCDAFHMTAPDPEGRGAAAAIRAALSNAGIGDADVDFLNLHGTGTPHNDAAEWHAISRVFGERAKRLPATSTKSAVGHSLGACGGLEAVVTVMSLGAGLLHPTMGDGVVDLECGVDLVVGEPRELERHEYAVSANLAFGGANGALVFRRWSGEGE